jgi:hypothetical protein
MTMEMIIKNNRDGTTVGVTPEGQLKVETESHSLAHHEARNLQQTYQAVATSTFNGNTTIMNIRNDDPERDCVIEEVSIQEVDAAGGTALPSVNTYFSLTLDRTVSSGGSAVTPINTNAASGKTAVVIMTDSGPTMAGTALQLKRWHPQSDSEIHDFDLNDAVILGLNDNMEVQLITDHTSGTAVVNITFMMIGVDE